MYPRTMNPQLRLRRVDMEWLDRHGLSAPRARPRLSRAVPVLAPGKLYGIMPGDTVKVTATVDYRGPALDENFYTAMGNKSLVGFDEIWASGSWPVHFGPDSTWKTYTMTANIAITQVGLFPWTPGWFDLYVKIGTGLVPRKMGPTLLDVIEVLLRSDFQNFNITSYEKV